jgi:hypothetical protein
MKAKYYFCEDYESAEKCFTLESMYEYMKDNGLTTLKIYPAKMLVGEDFYYCDEHQFSGIVGDGCGKDCSEYNPRNGKNGRCRHSKNCYVPDLKNPMTINQKNHNHETGR